MNRTALSLMMLRILKSRSLVKKQELAEILETNPRNIIELKKELETAGYQIDTIPGPAGGYSLNEKSLFSVPDLTEDEIKALQQVLSYIESIDITLRKEAQEALEKVLAVTSVPEGTEMIVSSGVRLNVDAKKLQKHYEMIQSAIEEKHRIKVKYRPHNTEIREWMIHPYGLFLYKGMWYCVGYRENDHEVTLKLNRIEEIEETDKLYSVPSDFNVRQYVSNYGITIGKKNRLVAEITGRYYLSEYIYGEDQVIEPIDDKTIHFEVTFPNELAMKSFVYQLGADCRVLEPESLKKEVKEQAQKILNQN